MCVCACVCVCVYVNMCMVYVYVHTVCVHVCLCENYNTYLKINNFYIQVYYNWFELLKETNIIIQSHSNWIQNVNDGYMISHIWFRITEIFRELETGNKSRNKREEDRENEWKSECS